MVIACTNLTNIWEPTKQKCKHIVIYDMNFIKYQQCYSNKVINLPSNVQSRQVHLLIKKKTLFYVHIRSLKSSPTEIFLIFYRIFWLLFVIMSWYGSSLLIAAQYDAFQNNPISFVVETTYKDWNTDFPSVALCEHDNTARIEHISDL